MPSKQPPKPPRAKAAVAKPSRQKPIAFPPTDTGWTPDDEPAIASVFEDRADKRTRSQSPKQPLKPLANALDEDIGADGERIAKRLARAGVCSRRDAERLIEDRRVKVNGVTLESPAVKVTAADVILVDNKRIGAPEETRLWRYHKPAGLVTTHRDPQGRPTVFERMPTEMPRVISVGRLDLTSEGLLLLTNSGELSRQLEHPSNGWVRTYRARAFGEIQQTDLDKLAEGIEVEGVRYGSIDATLDSTRGANAWITLSLSEGKNREVRRVLQAIGLHVNRLIRVSYGPFLLGTMPVGAIEEVPRKVLKQALGAKLAGE
jgi:23S rRNA pseudouridine2605 synthase